MGDHHEQKLPARQTHFILDKTLTARRHHACDNRADRGTPLRAAQAQMFELFVQTDLAQRFQRYMLNADAARAQHVKAVHIHRVIVRRRGGFIVASRSGVDHPRAITLRERFPARVQIRGHQITLSADQVFDTLRQCRPLLTRNVEVASEIDQGTLAHAALGAHRLHHAVGVVRLA